MMHSSEEDKKNLGLTIAGKTFEKKWKIREALKTWEKLKGSGNMILSNKRKIQPVRFSETRE